MTLHSIKTRAFVAMTLILAAVAVLVMTFSRQSVETAMIEAETRSIDNILALAGENIRGRWRTLLESKVATVVNAKRQFADFDRTVLETLDGFAALADAGLVEEDEARRRALAWLSRTRPVSGDYLLAFDAGNRALVVPDPSMTGADVSRFRDFKGRPVAAAAREEASRYGDAYLTFAWPSPDGGALEEKYGHFVLHGRWGWVIGSVGDVGAVEADVRRQVAQLEAELGDILADVRMAGAGVLIVFDADGRFLVPPPTDLLPVLDGNARAALQRLARDAPEGATLPLGTPGDGLLTARATFVKSLNWTVAAIASPAALQAPATALVERQAAIFAAALAAGLVGVFLFVHHLTRPLERLAAWARTVPERDFAAAAPAETEAEAKAAIALPVRRRDEIGRLALAFAHMDEALHRNVRSLMEATSARERIEGELNVARDIQMGLLPKTFPAFPDRPEIDLHSLLVSAREVGGDLFDYYFLDDHRLCFTIGDVAGKGVPAALFMAITKTLIKAAAETDDDPAAMLTKVNDDLSRDNPNAIFVTLLIGILDVRTGHVRYGNAGHNPPLVRRRTGTVDMLRGISGPAVGVMEDMAYATLETTLAPGDTIVLYTDGITEAMNAEHALYGETRLVSLVGNGEAPSSGALVDALMADVAAHVEGAEQSDDITILVLGYKGAAAPDRAPAAEEETA